MKFTGYHLLVNVYEFDYSFLSNSFDEKLQLKHVLLHVLANNY